MKTCSRCKKEKLLSEFNFKIKARGLYSYQCRECSRYYIKSHYNNNRTYYLLKAKKRNQKIRDEARTYIWNYLTKHPCLDCSEKDPVVLEFDHTRDKLFTISSVGRNRSLLQIKEEVKKCEIRCANCHRRKTAKQFGWHKKFMPL